MLRAALASLTIQCLLLGASPLGHVVAWGQDARQLHALIVADTSDEQVGELVNLDGRRLYDVLVDEIPAARRGLIKVIRGKEVTAANIVDHIRNLTVAADDSLFVYFTGHGAYVKDRGQVLRMAEGDLLGRSELLSLMKSKGAGLTILITDACSNIVEQAEYPKMAYSMAEGLDHDVCRYLFFRHRGVVDIHAASPGEEAVALHEVGSIFSDALINHLGMANARFRGQPITWREVTAMVVKQTAETFKSQRDANPDFRVLFPNQTSQTPKVGSLAEPIPTPLPKVPWRLGIKVQEAGGNGVQITEVFPNSQAEWAGFQVGEVLQQIQTGEDEQGRVRIRNSQDFMQTFWSGENALRPEVHRFTLLNPSSGMTRVVRARIRDVSVRQGP